MNPLSGLRSFGFDCRVWSFISQVLLSRWPSEGKLYDRHFTFLEHRIPHSNSSLIDVFMTWPTNLKSEGSVFHPKWNFKNIHWILLIENRGYPPLRISNNCFRFDSTEKGRNMIVASNTAWPNPASPIFVYTPGNRTNIWHF